MKRQMKTLCILLCNFTKKNAQDEKECRKVASRSASRLANIKLLCLLMSFAPILMLATCASNSNSGGGSTPAPRIPIVAGNAHSCAIANGQAFCWGNESSGRLGNGATTGVQTSPVAVRAVGGAASSTLTGVTAIAASSSHSCAIVANGQAVCWGSGANGRLGNGVTTNATSPVAVRAVGGASDSGATLTDVTAIAAGDAHSCAIANGQAFCWGAGGAGQLGNGATDNQSSPVAVRAVGGAASSTLTGVTAIATGVAHSCAIANGQAVCWGIGSLGNGATGMQSSPVAVRAVGGAASSTLTGVTTIAAGGNHSCAIANGQAVCWGSGANGRLGNGASTGDQSSPVAVRAVGGASDSGATLTGVTTIAAGASHSCAIVANGQAVCWGSGANGRLGNGVTTNATSPVAVRAVGGAAGSTLTGVTTIAAGGSHSCASANGQALCWGNGANGRLGNGDTDTQTSPVAVDAFPQ